MKGRTVVAAGLAGVALALAIVVDQAIETLRALTVVERERDTWQRPEDVLRPLELRPGQTAVDLGSGAGYFALKMAPRVAPHGKVIAVDLRGQSLAFLWIRAWRRGDHTLVVQRGTTRDPGLRAAAVDAVLIANTYHELAAPDTIMDVVFRAMRPGGRLVVLDHAARGSHHAASIAGHHDITADQAEHEIVKHGFHVVTRENPFVDRAGDDHIWWLILLVKPST